MTPPVVSSSATGGAVVGGEAWQPRSPPPGAPGSLQWYPDLPVTIRNEMEDSPRVETYNDIRIGNYKKLLRESGTDKDRPDCGTVKTGGACNNKPNTHRPILVPCHCNRRGCPVCYPSWSDQAGKRARDTLEGYLTARHGREASHTLQGEDRDRVLPRHVTWSPGPEIVRALVREVVAEGTAQEDFHRVLLKKYRKMANRVATAAGVQAGILMTHDIRLRKDLDADAADRAMAKDRYRAVLNRPGWRRRVKYSPHTHGIVFGGLLNARDFFREQGWIYRVIGTVHTPENLVRYLLSHAPDQPGVHSVSYIGEMAPENLVKLQENRIRDTPICEECVTEGLLPEAAHRVVGVLLPGSVRCENDGNLAERLLHGRGKPVAWLWDRLTDRPFVKGADRVGEYEIRVPGTPRPPARDRKRTTYYHQKQEWEALVRARLAPDSWFYPGGD